MHKGSGAGDMQSQQHPGPSRYPYPEPHGNHEIPPRSSSHEQQQQQQRSRSSAGTSRGEFIVGVPGVKTHQRAGDMLSPRGGSAAAAGAAGVMHHRTAADDAELDASAAATGGGVPSRRGGKGSSIAAGASRYGMEAGVGYRGDLQGGVPGEDLMLAAHRVGRRDSGMPSDQDQYPELAAAGAVRAAGGAGEAAFAVHGAAAAAAAAAGDGVVALGGRSARGNSYTGREAGGMEGGLPYHHAASAAGRMKYGLMDGVEQRRGDCYEGVAGPHGGYYRGQLHSDEGAFGFSGNGAYGARCIGGTYGRGMGYEADYQDGLSEFGGGRVVGGVYPGPGVDALEGGAGKGVRQGVRKAGAVEEMNPEWEEEQQGQRLQQRQQSAMGVEEHDGVPAAAAAAAEGGGGHVAAGAAGGGPLWGRRAELLHTDSNSSCKSGTVSFEGGEVEGVGGGGAGRSRKRKAVGGSNLARATGPEGVEGGVEEGQVGGQQQLAHKKHVVTALARGGSGGSSGKVPQQSG